MKISETTSYPHPVLAPWSSDIAGMSFATKVVYRQSDDGTELSIHCEVELNQPDLVSLIAAGTAGFGCFIRCADTGFRRLQRIGFPTGRHDFASGALLGRVQLRPVIWSVDPITGYNPAGAHPEFGTGTDVPAGQILALGDELIIEVTRPELAPLESIFEIVATDDVEDGEFEVNPEADRVVVNMSPSTYELVQHLRQTDDETRTVIMNALYVPIIMEVLDLLGESGWDQFDQYRWPHPFRLRCEQMEVDIEKLDLLNDAQKLLARPFASLRQLIDFEGEQ
jgi:hypothetical protein